METFAEYIRVLFVSARACALANSHSPSVLIDSIDAMRVCVVSLVSLVQQPSFGRALG